MKKIDLRAIFPSADLLSLLCIVKANTDGESFYVILSFLGHHYAVICFSVDTGDNFVIL